MIQFFVYEQNWNTSVEIWFISLFVCVCRDMTKNEFLKMILIRNMIKRHKNIDTSCWSWSSLSIDNIEQKCSLIYWDFLRMILEISILTIEKRMNIYYVFHGLSMFVHEMQKMDYFDRTAIGKRKKEITHWMNNNANDFDLNIFRRKSITQYFEKSNFKIGDGSQRWWRKTIRRGGVDNIVWAYLRCLDQSTLSDIWFASDV